MLLNEYSQLIAIAGVAVALSIGSYRCGRKEKSTLQDSFSNFEKVRNLNQTIEDLHQSQLTQQELLAIKQAAAALEANHTFFKVIKVPETAKHHSLLANKLKEIHTRRQSEAIEKAA